MKLIVTRLFAPLTACMIMLLFCSLFQQLPSAVAADRATEKYIRQYHAVADSKSKEYSIPYEVIMGIAIVESSSGYSRVSRELHNHFAIVGKNDVKRKTRFRQYATAEDSYDHFCQVIVKKKFYETLKDKTDYLPWVKLISQSGYSERPLVWRKRVLSAIEQNNL